MRGGRAPGCALTRPAVVCNPVSVDDVDALRNRIAARFDADLRWYETTVDDPGAGQTRQAVTDGADLLLVCGGDGTVSACAGALVNSGVPMAVLPVGTGNLLARNLDLPLDVDEALDVACGPGRRTIDLLESGTRRFAVMAGLGFDAAMIRETDDDLKARIGWPAYLVGVGRAIRRSRRTRYTVQVDDAAAISRHAVGVLVGNVGSLQGGVAVLPEASPEDGLLDVLLLAPRSRWGWPALAVRIAARRPGGPHAEVLRGKQVHIAVSRATPVEYDGDHLGDVDQLDVEVLPGVLTVCCRVS